MLRPSSTTLASALGARTTRFYDEQNEHIRALLKPLSKHAEEAQDAEDSSRLPVKIAVWASLAANCCLAVLQLYAAASSLSLSFFGAPCPTPASRIASPRHCPADASLPAPPTRSHR